MAFIYLFANAFFALLIVSLLFPATAKPIGILEIISTANDGPDISISIPKKKSKIRNNKKNESNKKVVKLNDIETKNNSKSIKKELTEKEKKERKIKQSNLFKSHKPENKNEDFYIVCPDCHKKAKGYRIVSWGNYDRFDDKNPEYRCKECSIKKMNTINK